MVTRALRATAVVVSLLLLAPPAGLAAKRRACLRACKPAIDACVAEGGTRRRCKADLLRACRRDGTGACTVTTTTTSTTTTSTLLVVPSSPTNVRLFSAPAGPPAFELRWDLGDTAVPVAYFVVYEADAAITTPEIALVAAVTEGAARAAEVALFAGTGLRHFRVTSVSIDGVEGAPSQEYVVDTSTRLVFRADKTTDNLFDLYGVVPGSGVEPTNLTDLPGPGAVDDAFPSPDGRRVAYTADRDTPGVFELYVAPVDGSAAPTKVSGTLVAGGQVATNFSTVPVAWSPDGSRIAFMADKETDEVIELFVVAADGSAAPRKVSGTLVAGGSLEVNAAEAFAWSSDGTRLAFLADKRTLGLNEVFVVPADGGTEPVAVSGTVAAGGNVTDFLWAPDGRHLAVRGRVRSSTIDELLVAPADATTAPVVVSGAQLPLAGMNAVLWSPDSTRLVLVGDRRVDGAFEPYVTLAAGGSEPVPLFFDFPDTADTIGIVWSPDGRFVAFGADAETDGLRELFVAPAAGGTNPRKVSGTVVANGLVFAPVWSPDSRRIAYIADAIVDNRQELFVTTPEGGPIAVSGTVPANADVDAFAWSPEGDRLALVADLRTDNVFELFVASALGGAAPVPVSGVVPATADVSSFGLFWTPLANP